MQENHCCAIDKREDNSSIEELRKKVDVKYTIKVTV